MANTMSTLMLVNDWQNHRTLLVIAAPEKPLMQPKLPSTTSSPNVQKAPWLQTQQRPTSQRSSA